jgi:RNA polymerase sigma-70 factor (ECF subfamily)
VVAQRTSADDPAAGPAQAGPRSGRALPRDPGRATEQLYRRHGGRVLRFAWHLLDRREDAEDATQATFLAVYRALGSGTAVLEPRAWIMQIARNECMARLRQSSRAPSLDQLDDVDLAAAGGVEQSAELRDEIRVARATLSALPEPERDAFLLHEWIGLESREVAVALGTTPAAVDDLAARARRRLVLAVGGLEPAAGCSSTRAALTSGLLGRATRVHLLRCPTCRGVRRALRPPEETLGRTAPLAVIAGRLADALPGFAGGGGIVAALATKIVAAPIAAKTAAGVPSAAASPRRSRPPCPCASRSSTSRRRRPS